MKMIRTKIVMKYQLLFSIFFFSIVFQRQNLLFSQVTKVVVTENDKKTNKNNKQIDKLKPNPHTNSTINRVNTQWKTNTNVGMYRGWPLNLSEVTTHKKVIKSMNDPLTQLSVVYFKQNNSPTHNN